MGKTLRIVVVVSQAHPELARDLESISPRLRAERLRMLATIGLNAIVSGGRVPDKATGGGDAESAEKSRVAGKIAREFGKLF